MARPSGSAPTPPTPPPTGPAGRHCCVGITRFNQAMLRRGAGHGAPASTSSFKTRQVGTAARRGKPLRPGSRPRSRPLRRLVMTGGSRATASRSGRRQAPPMALRRCLAVAWAIAPRASWQTRRRQLQGRHRRNLAARIRPRRGDPRKMVRCYPHTAPSAGRGHRSDWAQLATAGSTLAQRSTTPLAKRQLNLPAETGATTPQSCKRR